MLTNKLKSLDIKVHRNIDSMFLWTYKTFFRWRWLEFSDFREYEPGDDVKNIDFIVSAREWKTLTRLYREERELSVIFLLDLSFSMKFWLQEKTKFDTLQELFYILAYSSVKNGDKVACILKENDKFSYIKAKKWKANMFSIASKIEQIIDNSYDFSINEALNFLNNLKIKNNLVFLISDKFDFDEKILKMASIKNEIVFFHVFDDFENTLNWLSWVVNFVWENNENISINLQDKKKVEEYIKYRKNKLNVFKNTLAKLKIRYLMLDNKKNVFRELFLMFNK